MKLARLRRHAVGVPVVAALIMAPPFVQAQQYQTQTQAQDPTQTAPAPPRAWVLMPRLSISETLTDNVDLSPAKRSDLITEISPGIRLHLQGARVRADLDYTLTGLVYAQNSDSNEIQHALTAAGTLEAIDNWAFLDFGGSIDQQLLSAFGPQSVDNRSINANRSEVSTYRLSPYVRGQWHDLFNYEARYSRAASNRDAASDVTSVDSSVKLNGNTPFRGLGWSAAASRQKVDYSTGRLTEADLVDVGLSYALTPQLNVFVHGGRENQNYVSLEKENHSNTGFGVRWSPAPTTELSASRDQRFFGSAHNLSFTHRTPRTVWKFIDSRDLLVLPEQTGLFSLGTIFDLLFDQFATVEPDPFARTQLVNAFLLSNGVDPRTTVISNFLTSAVSLQRRQELSFALLGVRDTVTFLLSRGQRSRLDTLSTALDDLSTSSLIRQRGWSVNYAHRLTPVYSLAVLLSRQKASGTSSQDDSTLRALKVSVTGKVGPRAGVSVALRRVVFSANTSPYTENAITVTLNLLF